MGKPGSNKALKRVNSEDFATRHKVCFEGPSTRPWLKYHLIRPG